MPIREFKNPEDIKQYGLMVDGFARAMKAVADAKDLGVADPVLDSVVGEGRYNSRTEKAFNYIIYGQQKTAAAQGKYSGLFGAFYFVHRPELQMSQHAPVLLGKAGCKFQATIKGETYTVTLDKVHFDCKEREYDHYGTLIKRGAVILSKEVTLTAENGATITLPVDTPLTDNSSNDPFANTKIWKSGEPAFAIIDAKGKRIEEGAAALMLWTFVGAMGIKKYGAGTPRFKTIVNDGTDDDFTAEEAMIAWLESVKQHNGIDLMPAFNGYVKEASETLNSRSDMLACMAAAQKMAQKARPVVDCNRDIVDERSDRLAYKRYNILEVISGKKNTDASKKLPGVDEQIAATAEMLDLRIPEYEMTPELSAIYDAIEACDTKMRIMRIEPFIRRMQLERIRADFNNSQYLAGGRNRLKEAISAFDLIVAKIADPAPNDGPDVKEEVEILRDACAKIQRNYDARKVRAGSGVESRNAFFRKHQKALGRINDFLDIMDECDCDIEKLKLRFLHTQKLEAGFAALVSEKRKNRKAQPQK